MKKRMIGVLLSTAMVASSLAGCGGSAETGSTQTTADTQTQAADTADAAQTTDSGEEVTASEEGKVLNIYCWNEEFKSRLTSHYPGYTEVDGTTGTIGDVTVKWNITPSDDNAYQNNLDSTLLKQADAAADDKIDLFLIEADYALKYVQKILLQTLMAY